MSIAEIGTYAAVILTLLGILGYVTHFFSWAWGALKKRRETKTTDSYPAKLVWVSISDFDPESGYHDGYRIEVYNQTDNPIQIKGFGLLLAMQGQEPWERLEAVGGYPLNSFPRWLRARESFEGFIDAEALGDELHVDRVFDLVNSTRAYVEVSGHGRKLVDLDESEN